MRQQLTGLLTALILSIVPAAFSQTLPAQEAPEPSPTLPLSPTNSPAGNLTTQADHEESWTELALDKSGLAANQFSAVLLGKYEEPDYTREYWRVQWRPGDPIDMYIVLPHGISKPSVILYLYDYRFDTERFRSDVWCKAATQGGFAAVGFTSALSLQRQHAPRPMKEWFVSQLQEALSTSTHDVQMVLNYLASRGDLDVSHVGMYGQGSGGAIAVLAAAVDPRIVDLDLLNPWGDWPQWLKDSAQVPDEERSTYLTPTFLQGVAGMDPVLYLPHLKLNGLRVQQIMDDPVTPPSARDKIAAAVPHPGDLVQYKDGMAHYSAWRQEGLNGWLREQLRPATERASRNE